MSETLPITRPDGLEMRYLVVPLSDAHCAVSLINDSDAPIIVRGFRGPTLFAGWRLEVGGAMHDPNAVRFDRLEALWADQDVLIESWSDSVMRDFYNEVEVVVNGAPVGAKYVQRDVWERYLAAKEALEDAEGDLYFAFHGRRLA